MTRWAFLAAVLLLAWPGRSVADIDVETQLQEIRTTWYAVAESTTPFSTRYTMRLYGAEGTAPLKLEKERTTNRIASTDGVAFDNRTRRPEMYKGAERQVEEHDLQLLNDHYYCKLVDKSGDGQYILSGSPTMRDRKWSEEWNLESRLLGRLPWLQPSDTYRLTDLIDPKLCLIPKIEELGGGLLRITFRARTGLAAGDNEKFRGVTAGTLTLNRDRHYRLEAAEIQLDPERAYTASYRLTYEAPPEQDYLLKGVELEAKWVRNGVQMSAKQVWEYECRPDIEADPRQFYMSFYGLPEPVGVTPPKKRGPRYVWLLAAAASLGALALLFRWLVKRRSRAVSVSPPPAA